MSSIRNLSVVATMLASYAMSFAYLSWQHPAENPGTATPSPSPVAPNTQRVIPDVPRAASVGDGAQVSLPPPPVPVVGRPAPEAPQSADGRPEELLPVSLMVMNHVGHQQGLIRNRGQSDLLLTIGEVNSQSGETTQIQMTLGPDEHKTFSTDEGLEMRRGDKIIVHASGFGDREARIQ